MSVFSAISRPRRVAFHGVSGAGFSTQVLPIARTGPSLLRMISIGKFHGTITPTTPMGSFHTSARCRAHAEGSFGAEVTRPGEPVDLIGRPGEGLAQRRVELGAVGESTGQPTSAISSARSSSFSLLEGGLQLVEALLAEGVVADHEVVSKARRAAAIGGLHVGRRAVGDDAEHLLGGRVDVVEGLAALAVDELPVDQQPPLTSCSVASPDQLQVVDGPKSLAVAELDALEQAVLGHREVPLLEGHAQLHAREVRPQAPVGATAEGDVLVHLAVEVDLVGSLPRPLVGVGRARAAPTPASLGDRAAVELRVLRW